MMSARRVQKADRSVFTFQFEYPLVKGRRPSKLSTTKDPRSQSLCPRHSLHNHCSAKFP